MNKYSKGIIQILILVTLALVITGATVYQAYKSGYIRPTPSQKQIVISPAATISRDESLKDWKTYDALQDGFVEDEKFNFTFKYPPNFKLDHAGGPARDFGATSVIFSTTGMDLDINTVNLIGSPRNQAESFVQRILNKEANSINCDLLSSCDSNTFSIQETTLPNDIQGVVVTGPYFDEKSFDLYFIESGLSLWFTYKDRDRWTFTRDQILSSFKFSNSASPALIVDIKTDERNCKAVVVTDTGETRINLGLEYVTKPPNCGKQKSRISQSNLFASLEGVSGGIDSMIKIYSVKHNKDFQLYVYGTSTIFDFIFLPGDILAVLQGYPDILNEQFLRIYDIKGLFDKYPNNVNEKYQYFTDIDKSEKSLTLPKLNEDVDRLTFINNMLIVYGKAENGNNILASYPLKEVINF